MTACVLILALQATLIFLHEPWLDEWQALQIAVQSPTLKDLLENLRYEGHPPLYYLILRGTAVIVPLPWVLLAVQLPIAIATQSIILFRSFAQHWLRLCFALSAFVLIDYGTIARSLSLGVLILLSIWAFRNTRWAWVGIALLPAVDMLFGVLSLICLTIQWRDGRWSWPGVLGWLVSSLTSAWTVIPAPDMVPALPPAQEPLVALFIFIGWLAQLLLPLPLGGKGLMWNSTFPVPVTMTLGFVALFVGWAMRPSMRMHQLLIACFFAFALLFSLVVYALPIRHLSLIALLLIMLMWREQEMGLRLPKLFSVWLCLTACCGLLLAATNLIYPFDAAAQAARWIRRAELTNAHWSAFPDSNAQGVALMNGMDFTRLGRVCRQDFVHWNNNVKLRTAKSVYREMIKLSKKYGNFYLLSDKNILFRAKEITRLAYIPGAFNGQNYYIYKFDDGSPDTGKRPPACQPTRNPTHPWSLKEQELRHTVRQKLQNLVGIRNEEQATRDPLPASR